MTPKTPKAPLVYATVPRLWQHAATCVVLGSGASLTRDDVQYALEYADGVIAVNDAYLFAPNALALYAADDKWWRWHHGCVAPHSMPNGKRYPAFSGHYRYALERTAFPNVQMLRKGPETGVTSDPGYVALGRNGVYQATNVAVHFGARRILYLGVDMQGGHFFGRHPDNSEPPFLIAMQRFATLVAPLKGLGVSVINCTRKTALTCFPCEPLDRALPSVSRIAM